MLFTTTFNIKRTEDDDWFDHILNSDTLLFADPFLIFKEPESSRWSNSHAQLIAHFDRCFRLIAEGHQNPESLAYKKAVELLAFPEPSELCLGYTQKGTSGAGGGRGYARAIAEAIAEAISRGLSHLHHFEELGIFHEGIGADRISDITCNVLKSELITYTQDVSQRHDIPLKPSKVWASSFDDMRQRWASTKVNLPINPFNGKPIILIPQRFLRDLPQINDRDWWGWYENEQLRLDLNYEVLGNVEKKVIVDIARANPELVEKYSKHKESETAHPYDLGVDSNGVWVWHPSTRKYTDQNPLALPVVENDEEFDAVIQSILEQFKHFIEEAGGWRLLWNDDKKEKPESAAQLLFRGIAENYCRAANIVVDREVEFGRGPVDFKFSRGYSNRALIEAKKVHNGKFWNGLSEQLPSYLNSDKCTKGWFLAIQYRSSRSTMTRIRELPDTVHELNSKNPDIEVHSFVVDGRPKLSASKL